MRKRLAQVQRHLRHSREMDSRGGGEEEEFDYEEEIVLDFLDQVMS